MPDERVRQFIITAQFLSSVCKLAQQQCRKVWETLQKFARDPNSPGLKRERLGGAASGYFSIRVDRGFRIIFYGEVNPVLLFVGGHDEAYRFAERAAPRGLELPTMPTMDRARDWGWIERESVSSLPDEVAPKVVSLTDEIVRGARVGTDELEVLMLRTKKYLPITEFLTRPPPQVDTLITTFKEIEQMLGRSLPASARDHRAWWGNDRSRAHATAWLAVGWKTIDVRMDEERLTFVRRIVADAPAE